MSHLLSAARHYVGAALTLSILFFSTAAFAGTAYMNGFAEVSAKPDSVALQVLVKSDCYSTAADVSKANDQLAHRVLAILGQYVNLADKDTLTASGGYVERYTGYDPRNNQPLCVRTFRKENRLNLVVHDVGNFAKFFAEIQDRIYSLGMSGGNNNPTVPSDYVEMASPAPGLNPVTLKKMERQALTLALQDAKEKFEVTMGLAGVTEYFVSKYSENQNLSFNPIEKIGRSNDSSAPVQFGDMTLSKTLYVEFTYDNETLNLQ